ncbi:cysteine-rich CWC family protein [Comamonas aquatica]|uniref:Cysteine-rich CWC family protein n=1 Tax=Comamonas aquatica TaxID=225991 RepID=A0AA42W671_9BURK|nr:cysteine-rich CWC family protein [Comamonas aquatica]MDH1430219.1 cysteine-rich CWC family protein [Comamonas aquatica]MDH1607184.1 cysteine-rich CWC family protein [Comamonas aquatica]MDH1618998.1 cysteine-rich CWC family protein [Comamonas aquatica]MDH2006944.1 cysteine-rich CWC family protein [Comamonas aquatica]
MSAAPSPATCPLCGQTNACAVAAGLPPETCWCMQTRIPASVLERIPAAERGQRCVCPACGQTPPPPEAPR